MDSYLVTGGAGFIGSALVHTLVERGHRPRILDNFSTGRRENLSGLEGRIELIEGDIRDPATVARACKGVTFVLHEAAIPSVPRSVADPISSNDANVGGTLSLLVAARDAGVRRVVYAGSSSAYGDTPVLPKVETMTPAPLSPYAVSKLAAEHYCQAFTRTYGLETVVLRYFNVFGPRQDPASQYAAVVPKFLATIVAGQQPVVFGDGTQSRDFTYVENVVEANLLACSAPAANGQVMNIGCGAQFTLLELCSALGDLLSVKVDPILSPGRAGDVKHSRADISRARALLGYQPRIGFAEGLARLLAWTRAGVEGTR